MFQCEASFLAFFSSKATENLFGEVCTTIVQSVVFLLLHFYDLGILSGLPGPVSDNLGKRRFGSLEEEPEPGN